MGGGRSGQAHFTGEETEAWGGRAANSESLRALAAKRLGTPGGRARPRPLLVPWSWASKAVRPGFAPVPPELSLLTPKCGWQASVRVQDGSLQGEGFAGLSLSVLSCPWAAHPWRGSPGTSPKLLQRTWGRLPCCADGFAMAQARRGR